MKLRLSSIVSQLIAIGLHIYLSFEYYAVKFGVSSGESICNISAEFNCEAVAASKFASLFGIPVSVWGGTTNLVLLLLLGTWILRWSDSPSRVGRYCLYLAGLVAATSLVMGFISATLVGHYCAFCIAAYIMSFITFGLVFAGQESKEEDEGLLNDIKALFGSARPYAWYFVAIPVLAFILNKSFVSKYGAENIDNVVKAMVSEWQLNPTVNFNVPSSMSKGADDKSAVMTITEFADFRCGHCKQAAPSLGAFTASRADVRLNFYVFPLDGACNDAIPRSTGLSCLLSKAAYCANNTGQGWAMHDLFFKNQGDILQEGSPDSLEKKITELANTVSFDISTIKECIGSDETHQAILAQAKLGVEAKVQGTPTIFVNGRKLGRGQLIPVLEGAYNTLKK